MNEKQINKWLRRRFTEVGWVLIIYFVIMNILAVMCMLLDGMQQSLWAVVHGDFSGNLDLDAMMGNAWGYVVTIAVGLLILHAWKGPDYWKDEILVKEKKMTPFVLFCILSFCMGAQMVNSLWVSLLEMIMNLFGKSVMTVLESVSGDSDTFSMFLYASILAPISEEILFRGYVLRSLRPFGKRFAIFGSAVLFGLFHGNLLQTPYAILVGLVLGYVTVEYSIGWAVLLHMFNNLVLADLLTRLTASWSDMAISALNLLLFGGFALVSGAILIAKRRDIWEYNRSEWMDRRCLKCFFLNSGVLVLTVLMLINMISLLLL